MTGHADQSDGVSHPFGSITGVWSRSWGFSCVPFHAGGIHLAQPAATALG